MGPKEAGLSKLIQGKPLFLETESEDVEVVLLQLDSAQLCSTRHQLRLDLKH